MLAIVFEFILAWKSKKKEKKNFLCKFNGSKNRKIEGYWLKGILDGRRPILCFAEKLNRYYELSIFSLFA